MYFTSATVVCGRRAYIAPSAVLVYPRSVNTAVDWVCSSIFWRPNSQARTGTGEYYFLCSADHEQDWQPYPVDPYSAICDDHTYIHIYIHLLAAFLCNVLSVAFMSPEGSKIPKKVLKCPEAYHTILSGVPFSKHLPRLVDIIGLE